MAQYLYADILGGVETSHSCNTVHTAVLIGDRDNRNNAGVSRHSQAIPDVGIIVLVIDRARESAGVSRCCVAHEIRRYRVVPEIRPLERAFDLQRASPSTENGDADSPLRIRTRSSGIADASHFDSIDRRIQRAERPSPALSAVEQAKQRPDEATVTWFEKRNI